ncbi:MAG: hypothetical protein ACE5JI_05380 [Acidobacteriota bacterium]
MKASRSIMGAIVFLSILALASSMMAQSSMPAKHLQMYELRVKAGATAQFENYLKKLAEAANKAGAPQGWFAARAVLGTNGTNYYVFLGCEKWSERDSWNQVPQFLAQAFGEAEAGKILKMGGDAIWSYDTKVFMLDEERSWNLKAAPPAPYYQILIGKVKPDMVEEYQRVISRVKEAQEKSPSKQMGIRRSTRFGPSWEFYSATPFQKWGDWDEGPGFWEVMAKAHGEDEARHLQRTLRNCYEERKIFVIAARPDLSRQAPSPTSNE